MKKTILSILALLSLASALSGCIVEPAGRPYERPYRDQEVHEEHVHPHYCDRRNCW